MDVSVNNRMKKKPRLDTKNKKGVPLDENFMQSYPENS